MLTTSGRVHEIGRSVRALTTLTVSRAPAVGYIGWLGFQNLGDDVMYLAARERLRHVDVAPISDLFASRRLEPLVGRIMRRRLDALVFGGGTQFCNRGWRRELEDIERRTGPLPLFPLGVGVEMGTLRSESPSVWAPIFDRCDRVTVRGPRSQRRLAEFGIDAEVVGDSALLVEAAPRPGTRQGIVGINIGPVDPVPVSPEQLIVVAAAVAKAAIAAGYDLVWIAAIPEDIPLLLEARRRTGGAGPVLESFRDPLGFVDRAAMYELVVSTKLHIVVLAALAGVPFVSLAYEEKCLDFAESIDCLDVAVELGEPDAITRPTVEAFELVEQDREHRSQRITEAIGDLRARLLTRVDDVEQAVISGQLVR